MDKNFNIEKVTFVKHYTDRLFRFKTSRSKTFRFRSGEFAMIGLEVEANKQLFRAYSMTCPAWSEELEFYSIKIPDGPFTKHLQKIKVGNEILIKKKTTGTLVHDALTPGKNLYLISTGTGIAPFASIIRDPETYEKFDKVILTQTCRYIPELEYGINLFKDIKNDPLIGQIAYKKLFFFNSTTQEESRRFGRITKFITSQELFSILNMPVLNAKDDRIMICGSMGLLKDLKKILTNLNFFEGSNRKPGEFVIERAFVG